MAAYRRKEFMIAYTEFEEGRETIAVVGLGYVGLPLAVALARKFKVLGFDISTARVKELGEGHDSTGEVADKALKDSGMAFTCKPEDLAACRLIIVAVPTPIDAHRNPDLGPVEKASATVGRHMSRGAVVVFESTVYPGVTEDTCVPILERESGLVFMRDFEVGYSPERINPGDKVHTVDRIVKVISASSPASLDLLDKIYSSMTSAGVFKASSIKIAEAAKVIENTQRDLNIALMNELALIFDRLGIDTLEVLRAAGTKWNFLSFKPGLVGGHCIGVDPYYLTYKAEESGYHPEVILSGRRINDGMGKYVAQKAIKMLIAAGCLVGCARIGILGLTFKENVPDLRNTRVVDIKTELEEFGAQVLVHDPLADTEEALAEYGFSLCPFEEMQELDAIIAAVSHDEYKNWELNDLRTRFKMPDRPILLDIKGMWPQQKARDMGFAYWRL